MFQFIFFILAIIWSFSTCKEMKNMTWVPKKIISKACSFPLGRSLYSNWLLKTACSICTSYRIKLQGSLSPPWSWRWSQSHRSPWPPPPPRPPRHHLLHLWKWSPQRRKPSEPPVFATLCMRSKEADCSWPRRTNNQISSKVNTHWTTKTQVYLSI